MRSLSGVLGLLLAVPGLAGCGGNADGKTTSSGLDAGGGAGGGGSGGIGGGGGGVGGSGGGGTGGSGGTIAQPQLGAALVFQPTTRIVLVDTQSPQPGSCGSFAPIDAGNRRLIVDLDDCAVSPDAMGVVGSITIATASTTELDVHVQASDALVDAAPLVVGPLQSATHGFVTTVGADRAFVIDVPGSANADVLVELSAVLVPEAAGGAYVHLLDQPLRWFASHPNDDGFRDVWSRLETVLRYPVVEAAQGATGMFGAVHLGPAVWRSVPVSFHMGAAGPAGTTNNLPRWANAPVDAHFPWRYSSLFLTGASAAQEIELRSSSTPDEPWETGIEPWIDVVGWLSPTAGLVYRPLDRPIEFAPVDTENEDDLLFDSGFPDATGVMGSLVFDLPPWPNPEQNRWFFVMVADDASAFPGALGGGLEGPDWMTAGLNQNGRVTVRFVTRTDGAGKFVLRHHSYVAGGGTVDPAAFVVTAHVRIDGVLTSN